MVNVSTFRRGKNVRAGIRGSNINIARSRDPRFQAARSLEIAQSNATQVFQNTGVPVDVLTPFLANLYSIEGLTIQDQNAAIKSFQAQYEQQLKEQAAVRQAEIDRQNDIVQREQFQASLDAQLEQLKKAQEDITIANQRDRERLGTELQNFQSQQAILANIPQETKIGIGTGAVILLGIVAISLAKGNKKHGK